MSTEYASKQTYNRYDGHITVINTLILYIRVFQMQQHKQTSCGSSLTFGRPLQRIDDQVVLFEFL